MQKILLVLLSTLLLSGCTLRNPFSRKPAGIQVSSSPTSTVYIDGKHVGETPYTNLDIKAGEYTLKLVPASADVPLSSWETRVKLAPQVTTIIDRAFAANDWESSSYVLQLEPQANTSEAFLSVISDPDSANVTVDGKPQGFTPLTKLSTDPGNHTIEISSPGFKGVSIGVNAVVGYNLIVNSKLAKELITLDTPPAATDSAVTPSPSATPTPSASARASSSPKPSPTVAEVPKPYVLIGETETGWLRVRETPNATTGKELGKVNVGEKYPYLDTSGDGWIQIQFTKDAEGWVAAKYVTVVR